VCCIGLEVRADVWKRYAVMDSIGGGGYLCEWAGFGEITFSVGWDSSGNLIIDK